MNELVEQELVEMEFDDSISTHSFLKYQAKAGLTVRCILDQGENAELVTKDKEYLVVAGKGEEFALNVSWDEAGIIDDEGNPLVVILNDANDSVTSGAVSQFAIVDDEAFQKSL